jgi:hypothetical protein
MRHAVFQSLQRRKKVNGKDDLLSLKRFSSIFKSSLDLAFSVPSVVYLADVSPTLEVVQHQHDT